MDLIEEIKKEIKDRTTKTKITKLSSFLFQAPPLTSSPRIETHDEYKHNSMEHIRLCKKAKRH